MQHGAHDKETGENTFGPGSESGGGGGVVGSGSTSIIGTGATYHDVSSNPQGMSPNRFLQNVQIPAP
jgi:hypothetical protein